MKFLKERALAVLAAGSVRRFLLVAFDVACRVACGS